MIINNEEEYNNDDSWEKYTEGIKPLCKSDNVDSIKIESPSKKATKISPENHSAHINDKDSYNIPTHNTIDNNNIDSCYKIFSPKTLTKKERKRITIDAKLDFHGMTQDTAFDKLCQLVHYAYNNGKRNLLVITGKGNIYPHELREGTKENTSTSMQQRGVIRRNLPTWLSHHLVVNIILELYYAPAELGGMGAFIIRLKKNKNK